MRTGEYNRTITKPQEPPKDKLLILNENLSEIDRKLLELSRAIEALTCQASQALRERKPANKFLDARRKLELKADALGKDQHAKLRERFLLGS